MARLGDAIHGYRAAAANAELAINDPMFPGTSFAWTGQALLDRYLRGMARLDALAAATIRRRPERQKVVLAATAANLAYDFAARQRRTALDGWRLRTRLAASLAETAVWAPVDAAELGAAPAAASTAEAGFRYGMLGVPVLIGHLSISAGIRALLRKPLTSGRLFSPTLGFVAGLAVRRTEAVKLAEVQADRTRSAVAAAAESKWTARWEVNCEYVPNSDGQAPLGDQFTLLSILGCSDFPEPLRSMVNGDSNRRGTQPAGIQTAGLTVAGFYEKYNRQRPRVDDQLHGEPPTTDAALAQRFLSPEQVAALERALTTVADSTGTVRQVSERRFRGYGRTLDIDIDGTRFSLPPDFTVAAANPPVSHPLPGVAATAAMCCLMDATSMASQLPLVTVIPGAAANAAAVAIADRLVRTSGRDATIPAMFATLAAGAAHAAATLRECRRAPAKANGDRRTPITQGMFGPALIIGYGWPHLTSSQRTVALASCAAVSAAAMTALGKPYAWRHQFVNWVHIAGAGVAARVLERRSETADDKLRQLHQPAIEQRRAEIRAEALPAEWRSVATAARQGIEALRSSTLPADWNQARVAELRSVIAIAERHVKEGSIR